MSLSLQQHIFNLLSHTPSMPGLLNLRTVPPVAGGAFIDSFVYTMAQIFIMSDMLLYVGCVFIILVLGSGYKQRQADKLVISLVRTSNIFIYLALLINLLGLIMGSELIASHDITIFEGSYTFNLFSQLCKLLLLVMMASFYVLFPTVIRSRMRILELPLLLQISVSLCVTIISSTNFALLLLALEGFSLTLYILTALGRTYGGVTAAVKYFAFGTLGSIFLFWGVVHLYALVPSLSFEVINALQLKSQSESASLITALNFANTCISFGFMLKLGAAPVHQWVADVYAGAHMYITAFFSIFVKFVLFIAFIRIASHFNSDALVNQFIIFSLFIGCFMSINQTEIKRFLAYSSIVHVAFLLMGDASSSLIYLLTYVLSSLIIFSILLSSELGGKEIVYLNDLKFLRGTGFFNISCLVIALASSAGLPPFAGFYGKFLVWSSLIEDIYLTNSLDSYCILFLSIAISLITIYYYMRVIAYLFVGQDSQNRAANTVFVEMSRPHRSLLFLQFVSCVIVTAWTFVQPYVLPLIQFAALSL